MRDEVQVLAEGVQHEPLKATAQFGDENGRRPVTEKRGHVSLQELQCALMKKSQTQHSFSLWSFVPSTMKYIKQKRLVQLI